MNGQGRGNAVEKFWNEEDGIGTLEIVLIIAIVIIVALLFKDWIVGFIKNLMSKTKSSSDDIFTKP